MTARVCMAFSSICRVPDDARMKAMPLEKAEERTRIKRRRERERSWGCGGTERDRETEKRTHN